MSDMDEDLLALAGAGDSGEETEDEATIPIKRSKGGSSKPRKRSRRETYSDDDDDEDDDSGEDGADEIADDDDEETEDEEFIKNPYPLEGKYINEQDKARLLNMPEIQREEELYERTQQMEEFRQKEMLIQRAKERKKQEKRAAGGRAKKPEPRGGLSELKKRRQDKETRIKRREEGLDVGYDRSESEDEEDDYEGEEDEYEDEEKVEWAEPAKTEPVTASDLNDIRWARAQMAKYFYYPGFDRALQGSFVRVKMDSRRYEVGIAKELVESQPYTLVNNKVDRKLKIAVGPANRVLEMSVVSDSKITAEEFTQWKQLMDENNLAIISKRKVEKKVKDLKEFQSRQLSEKDIDDMIKKKKQLGASIGADAVVEKSALMEARQIALDKNDYKQLESIDKRIRVIDQYFSKVRRKEQDRLAKVNERNRKSNVNEIRRAEIRFNEAKKKIDQSAVKADPFSRFKTRGRMFYSTQEQIDRDQQQQRAEENITKAIESSKSVKKVRGILHLDDVVGALDLQLDIQL